MPNSLYCLVVDSYESKKASLARQVQTAHLSQFGIQKDTSNLFRKRPETRAAKIDVRHFNQVLQVNPQEGYVEVEGMTPYAALVDETLKHQVMPGVVPELKSITIGGAVSGVGIESSSFRHGLVHETILEMDVLLSSGDVVTCSPDNEYRDLFYGLPNSYGTLGYILKLKAKTQPVKGFVHLTHYRHHHAADFFVGLEEKCNSDADFVDGVIFGPDEFYVTTGQHTADAPRTSDYTFEHIYYQSIRNCEEDFLTTHDYIWRWDTDWFWCSKNLGMQNPLLRRLAGRKRLNSTTYTRIMRWNARHDYAKKLDRLRGLHTESVIQDICIPIGRANEYLEFMFGEIGILPIWTCPARHLNTRAPTPLFPMNDDVLYIDFGFWDILKTKTPREAGHFNKLIEAKTLELGGAKSLYSQSFYDRDTFWSIYNEPQYRALKEKYDPGGRLRDLYEKCVTAA
ncbi:MAG TPA: FAD-binding oxidoreductase [Xanthomonadales bacterium]|nr:FAD-binding oxidoreductase [Xanthomonadales bacterium]